MTRPAARGFWPVRDLPVVLWLLAALVAGVLDPDVPAPRWLLIHLLLLGAVSHSILVWSRHFADALLHTAPRDSDRRVQSTRLLLLDLGVLAVLVGVTAEIWPLTVAGACGVAVSVGWHAVELAGQLRRALASRFAATARYYVAAACLLPFGAALGTWLARGVEGPLEERVVLAHVAVNVLGWIGLTVVGTLVTLWPTMLRTRIEESAEPAARAALPVLVGAVALVAVGALAGSRIVAAAGLALYLVGLARTGRALLATARRKRPAGFATCSVAAALGWLVGALLVVMVGVGTASSWEDVGPLLDGVTPFLAVGFGAQLLLGALSYLLPMALGGGPAVVRARNAVLDRAAGLRVGVVNGALLISTLPVPGPVQRVCAALVVLGLAGFLLLLALSFGQDRGRPWSSRWSRQLRVGR